MKHNPKKDLYLKYRAVDNFVDILRKKLKSRMKKGTRTHRNDWRCTNLESKKEEELLDYLNYEILKTLQWRTDRKKRVGVCFDLDGVILKKYKTYHYGKLQKINQPVKLFINKLFKKYTIIIFTARRDEELPIVARYLKRSGLNFDLITNIKYPAVLYIDDRAYRYTGPKDFNDIEQVLYTESKKWLKERRRAYKPL